MSEDKMKADFDRWIFDPSSEGYPLRHTNAAWYAWKACAAIKDAEIAQLKTDNADLHNNLAESNELLAAANKEIAARGLTIQDLRETVYLIRDVAADGGFWKDELNEALAKSEHHNSRTLEKMLLEARIDELEKAIESDYTVGLRDVIANLKAKLAELNNRE